MMKTYPMLYKLNKDGSFQQWTVQADNDQIISTYGQVGGKMQVTSKTAKPKNVGKANETTGDIQAIKQAKAMWKKKYDKEYAETIEEACNPPILPMLAKKYKDRKDRINWDTPQYIQPKLDGVRCLAYWKSDELVLVSRQNKKWAELNHIKEELIDIVHKTKVFDGEIYVHGLTFQEISSLVKKTQTINSLNMGEVGTTDLEFHVYDIFDKDFQNEPHSYRISYLRTHSSTNKIKYVPTLTVRADSEIEGYHKSFIEQGYEGAILRLSDGKYITGGRSSSLLKIKSFMDKEFEIVGYTEGEGRFKGAVTWVCRMESGDTFECTPKGTMEQKRIWFENGNEYIGEYLKVQFFDYTDAKIPRFPVGIGIRLVQDM